MKNETTLINTYSYLNDEPAMKYLIGKCEREIEMENEIDRSR